MEEIIGAKIQQVENRNFFYILTAILLVCVTLSGCIDRVAVMTRRPTGRTIDVNKVKFLTGLKDVNEPWQVEGMISAHTLPVLSNSFEKREALIRRTAAGLGINTVVGLQPDVGTGLQRTGRSMGILVNTGAMKRPDTNALPKFIICSLPVNNLVQDLPQNELDAFLLEFEQFMLTQYKGYYVYQGNATGLNKDSILKGDFTPKTLSSPIGIDPDYALTGKVDMQICGEEFYMNLGKKTASHTMWYCPAIHMTLIDLTEKKPVWEKVAILSPGWLQIRALPMTLRADIYRQTGRGLSAAMNSIPIVTGFDGTDLPPVLTR